MISSSFFRVIFALFLLSFSSFEFFAQNINEYAKLSYFELYTLSDDDIADIKQSIETSTSDKMETGILNAKILFVENNYEDALEILFDMYKQNTTDNEISFYLARAYSLCGKSLEASNILSEISSWNRSTDRFIKDIVNEFLPYVDKDEYDNSFNKLVYILKQISKFDPTPATPVNEYFDTIIKRTEYVLRNFLTAGFIDARGDIYRKYGAPTSRQDFLHPNYQTECWAYYNLAKDPVFFDFIFSTRSPQWKLVNSLNDLKLSINDDFYPKKGEIEIDWKKPYQSPSNTFFENRSNISTFYREKYLELYQIYLEKNTGCEITPKSFDAKAENIVRAHLGKETKEQLLLPKSIIRVNIPTIEFVSDICRFKIDDNTIRVENYIGFSISLLEKVLKQVIPYDFTLNTTITIKDIDYKTLNSLQKQIRFEFKDPKKANFFDMISVDLPNENYIFAIEAMESDSMFNMTTQNETKTSEFLLPDLFLSDIQFSLSVASSDMTDNKNYKNGLLVQPYPYHFLYKYTPYFIYFEIYNLSMEHGLTGYNISYRISEIESGDKEEYEISDTEFLEFEENYKGNKINDFLYLQIDPSDLSEGEYELALTVTDNQSKKSFTRRKFLSLTDD